MPTIERFEDIEAWQGTRALVKAVYDATGQGPFAHDYGLRDQIRRASVSIMSNIAEGFERGSDKELRQFLIIAKASAGEVRSLLYVALDLAYLDGPTYEHLTQQASRVSRQIAKFAKYLGGGAPPVKNGRQSTADSDLQTFRPSDLQT